MIKDFIFMEEGATYAMILIIQRNIVLRILTILFKKLNKIDTTMDIHRNKKLILNDL